MREMLDAQPPTVRRTPAHKEGVYVFAAVNTKFVKIGRAKNVHKRLPNVQNGCPHVVRIAFFERHPQAALVERTAHKKLAKHRASGEWFKCSAKVAIQVVREAMAEAHLAPVVITKQEQHEALNKDVPQPSLRL